MKRTSILFLVCALAGLAQAGRWICGDTHHHTSSSSDVGAGSTAMLYMQSGVSVGYNFMLVTDHVNFGEYWNGNVTEANRLYRTKDRLCIIGMEAANGGHWTLFGVRPEDSATALTPVSGSTKIEKWQSAIRRMNGRNAWFSVNHPHRSYSVLTYEEFRALAEAGMAGFEIYNGGDVNWSFSKEIWPVGGWWDSVLADGHKMVGLAGSDAHGSGCDRRLRTWVHIDSDSVTEEALMAGLKKGRVWAVAQQYGQNALCADCFSLEFSANDSMIGSAIPAGADSVTVRIAARLDSCALRIVPRLTSVRLISNGVTIWQSLDNGPRLDTLFRVPVSSGRYLRVEVLAANVVRAASELRAYSSPIYLEGGPLTIQAPEVRTCKTLLSVSPNPFRGTLEIRYSLGSPAPASLEIFSADGRRVWKSGTAVVQPGTHLLRWDGRDALGRPLAAGFYGVRLQAAGGRQSIRALLMK